MSWQVPVGDVADAAMDGVQRSQRVRQKRFAGRLRDQLIDAMIELVELVDRQRVCVFSRSTCSMWSNCLRWERDALCCQANDETIRLVPQAQQQSLARQINRRDLQAMARADDDQRVG
jgi:site-specific recombinase XerD